MGDNFFKAHIIVDFGSGTITQKRLSNTTVSIEIWHPSNNGNLMFPKISKLKLSMKAKKKSHFTRLTKCLMPFFSATDSNSYAHTRDIITQELPPCPLDQMNYYFFFSSPFAHTSKLI